MTYSKLAFATSSFLMLASLAHFTPAASHVVQVAQAATPEGVWTGSLLQKDWTFEFIMEGDRWSGRYMSPGGVKWHPLSDVSASGRSLSFKMDSKPKLSFALEVDPGKPVMSGTATIEGVATVPFTATRKS